MIREHELAELVEKQKGQIAQLTEREQKLHGAVRRYVEADVSRALTAAGGPATLLVPHVMAEVRVVEQGDGFRAVVVGQDGKTPRIKNGSGDAMSIEDLVAEFKTRPGFGDAFGAGGSDAVPSRPTHQISAADAKNNAKYLAAKEAAAKAGVELEIVDAAPVSSGSTHKITAADAKDNRKYSAAKEAAERAGGVLEITD